MIKQRRLAFFEQTSLEALWEQFPKQARDEVTQQYARLMASATVARIQALRTKKNPEVSDETTDG